MISRRRIRAFFRRITARTGQSIAAQEAMKEVRKSTGGRVEMRPIGQGKTRITIKQRNQRELTPLQSEDIRAAAAAYLRGAIKEGARQ